MQTLGSMRHAAKILAGTLLVACGPGAIDEAAEEPVVGAAPVVEEGDVLLAPELDRSLGSITAQSIGAPVLFVNFNGGTISGCPSTNPYCSNAFDNLSWLVNNTGR